VPKMIVTKLSEVIGVEVTGCDLRELTPEMSAVLEKAINENLVVCIRDQHLTKAQFRDAMVIFGDPDVEAGAYEYEPSEVPEIHVISHEAREKTGRAAGSGWHSDQSFRKIPTGLTMLYALEIPEVGGDTQFANMQAAYDALPDELKAEIDSAQLVHRYHSSRRPSIKHARTLSKDEEDRYGGDTAHPLVRTHPVTGRKGLYLNSNRMDHIVGMTPARSADLLDQLEEFATREQFQYRHKWRAGDTVIWDNRATMHQANGDYAPGARRVLLRMTTKGEEVV
jgi:taurine dioxygenase